jgi:katanin p60 ATPase-containing subunit A1
VRHSTCEGTRPPLPHKKKTRCTSVSVFPAPAGAKMMRAEHGAWLVIDNTYEHFAYPNEAPHECIEAAHIVNVFSFSKAFGMMGWRVGYLAYPPPLAPELLKAQDTIVICPSILSQRLALAAMAPGRRWVHERVSGLAEQKALVLEALTTALPAGSIQGGSGAIYLFCKLPVEDASSASTARLATR